MLSSLLLKMLFLLSSSLLLSLLLSFAVVVVVVVVGDVGDIGSDNGKRTDLLISNWTKQFRIDLKLDNATSFRDYYEIGTYIEI